MKLRKELKYKVGDQDKVIKEVKIDFDKITTKDIYDVEQNVMANGTIIQNFEFSKSIQWGIVSKAIGIPEYLDTELHPSDFLKLCREAQRFLLGVG